MVNNVNNRILLTIILFVTLLFSSGCMIGQILPYYMGSYSGRVIDIDTGRPIAGAVVSVIYTSSSSSPAGVLSADIDAQETLTDANGEFVIPKVAVQGTGNAGYPEGEMTIFKPGYGVLSRGPSTWFYQDDKPPRVVNPMIKRDKYIVYQLPKLRTLKERRDTYPSHSSVILLEKQRLLIQAINEERRNLGFQSMITEPKVKQGSTTFPD